jgi:hypothetical protein
MKARAVELVKLGAGGLVVALLLYAIAFAGHVLEQIHPCRATDPDTGVSHAVSCLNQPSGEGP